MKTIDGAIQQWALENKVSSTNEVDTNLVTSPKFLEYLRGSAMPVCGRQGTYVLGKTVGDEPTCSFHGTAATAMEVERKVVNRENWRATIWPVLVAILLGIAVLSKSIAPLDQRKSFAVGVPILFFVLFTMGVSSRIIFTISQPFVLVTSLACLGFSTFGVNHPRSFVRIIALASMFVEVMAVVGAIDKIMRG